ncbi:MAG TPA: chlorite dismutase family protein [Ktedonobacterales bacterium]|nr:chlorite dismutase family protein [Ktedonobacterales bacterium]
MATGSAEQTTYAAYWLYALDPTYSRLPEAEQTRGKAEFLAALEARPSTVGLRGAYSMVGFREDVDFMLWVVSTDLDAIQRLAVSLRHTGLGRYLATRQTYVGVVADARYDPAHAPAFMQGAPAKTFISVYPFVKTAEWYLLPYERRRDLMAEHGLIGRKYAVPREQVAASGEQSNGHGRGGSTATAVTPAPAQTDEEGGGVLANTVDAFGLGDYEFILANESDDASELVRMMQSLRATEVRRYTKLDTPIFLGRLREPSGVLADL